MMKIEVCTAKTCSRVISFYKTGPIYFGYPQVGPPEGLHGAAAQLQPRPRQREPTGRPSTCRLLQAKTGPL